MGNQKTGLEQTDPELDQMMKKYIYGDIASQAKISRRDQHLVTLAVLTTYQSEDLLAQNVQGALHDGVTPLEIRETEYHLAPYIGFAKVTEAMKVVDGVFKKHGIRLPLPDQGTTTDADRFDKGLAFQVGTYGDRIVRIPVGDIAVISRAHLGLGMFFDNATVVIAIIQIVIGIRLGRLDFKQNPFLVVGNRFGDAFRISRCREIDNQYFSLTCRSLLGGTTFLFLS